VVQPADSRSLPELPRGVVCRRLVLREDTRGSFAEIFRDEWGVGVHPIQWNLFRSGAGALRGFRVHPYHDDCLVHFSGSAWVGLRDMRCDGADAAPALLLEIAEPTLLTIPRGVCHGIYCREESFQAVGVSRYYDPADELRVRWDDPELGVRWPQLEPQLSAEDAAAGSFAEFREAYRLALADQRRTR
jgi:dTDP-4-dehydrorhamnose 3,5-epimerase